MTRLDEKNIEDYIAPLNMNGLQGRMLRMPPPADKKREILFIYGHHSDIERWWPFIQELNNFGAVTVPDLPGFGGMQSLYKIGQKPTIDTLADYLAAFVKLRYKRRRVTIIGVSFGFVVVTRMLQRYPDIAKKTDMLISLAGFAHRDDFQYTRSRRLTYKTGAIVLTQRLPAWMFRHGILQPAVIRRIYLKTQVINPAGRAAQISPELQTALEKEIRLWHQNDVRTHMKTAAAMLGIDNCQIQIDLPVWHLSVPKDRYLNNSLVEQHLKVIFSNYQSMRTKFDIYDPQAFDKLKPPGYMMPYKLRRLLARVRP